jgi:WD40 repeat protein
MKGFLTLLTVICPLLSLAGNAFADDADLYAVQFSADGKYLITGGSGGRSTQFDANYTGGVKIWDASSGELLKAFGQQKDIYGLFGDNFGRVGKARWTIHNFRDVVFNGSYPDGKVLLLPSSLGEIKGADGISLPPFIGGYMDFSAGSVQPIAFDGHLASGNECGNDNAASEYVGPIIASENGRYAAVVVNTCKQGISSGQDRAEYDSTLHLMDLNTLEVTHSFENLDSGVYAIGVTGNGDRIAYVGRDRFAVLDVVRDTRYTVEEYPDGVFEVPRQFSRLYFDQTGNKLVSLHYIYDIAVGTEEALSWPADSAITTGKTSSVRVAPDLSFFVLVKPERSMILFGDDGLPQTYGRADRVVVVEIGSGRQAELPLTDSRVEGKRCVTDVSPDSQRIAVACTGGLIKVFDAASHKPVWEQRNIGYLQEKLDKRLIHARGTSNGLERLPLSLARAQ